MYIDNLMIEITRNCNLDCKHCLRGKRQTAIITNDVIDILSKKIKSIETITFTGGEPLLCLNKITHIRKMFEKNNVNVNNFYIATNGTICNKDIIYELIQWYNFCTDNEITCLDISNTQYHLDSIARNCLEEERSKNEKRFKSLIFTQIKPYQSYEFQGIIKQGKSKNGRELINVTLDELDYDEDDNSVSIYETLVYVNFEGYVSLGCDYSYDNQKIICHIKDLKNYCLNLIKEEQHV